MSFLVIKSDCLLIKFWNNNLRRIFEWLINPQRSFTYNNDPDKEKEVGGEQREDGDLHHDVKLAVDEEGTARTGQVRGEVLQKLNHDQQQRVSYRGAW